MLLIAKLQDGRQNYSPNINEDTMKLQNHGSVVEAHYSS